MAQYTIDGFFLTQQVTGTQRYAYEITSQLDVLAGPNEIEVLVPTYTSNLPRYKNISIVKYGSRKGILWQQLDLAFYLRKNNRNGLFFNNILPILHKKGIITIHDVCYTARPEFYLSIRDRLSRLWHCFNYWEAARSDMKILTVSEFSKDEIIRYYHIAPSRINVGYNGWQHIERIAASEKVFEKYNMLEKGKYFFSLSTLGANKNFKWILYAAKNHPEETFAVAGGGKLKGAADAMGLADLPNVFFLGYLSDEEIKSLMENCKAFIFPTLYEGFGLTPLEAVACGCKRIVVSDTPCMHEIYGDFAEYLDPYYYDNIELSSPKEHDMDGLLEKYSWTSTAKLIYSICFK